MIALEAVIWMRLEIDEPQPGRPSPSISDMLELLADCMRLDDADVRRLAREIAALIEVRDGDTTRAILDRAILSQHDAA